MIRPVWVMRQINVINNQCSLAKFRTKEGAFVPMIVIQIAITLFFSYFLKFNKCKLDLKLPNKSSCFLWFISNLQYSTSGVPDCSNRIVRIVAQFSSSTSLCHGLCGKTRGLSSFYRKTATAQLMFFQARPWTTLT